MATDSQISKDVDLKNLVPGSRIDVETKSRHYLIECLGGDQIRISGHPDLCPEPVLALVKGSIEHGKPLKFFLNDYRPVTTTRIVRLRVDAPKSTPHKTSPSLN